MLIEMGGSWFNPEAVGSVKAKYVFPHPEYPKHYYVTVRDMRGETLAEIEYDYGTGNPTELDIAQTMIANRINNIISGASLP